MIKPVRRASQPVTLILLAAVSMAAGCSPTPDDIEPDQDPTRMTIDVTEPQHPFLLPANLDAPTAERRPLDITQHGTTRTDNYAWLRDDNWQDVLREPGKLRADIRSHLEAENAFYSQATSDMDALRTELFEEMRGRIKEDDSTVPTPDGKYAYAVRFRDGGEYAVYVRTPRAGGDETVLFDGDLEAEGADFFDIGTVEHSPDHAFIAWSVDRAGSEYFEVRVRHIDNGEEFAETVVLTDGSVTWAADSKSFFYTELDDNHRGKRVKRHLVGTDPADDEIVYEEPDNAFFLGVSKSHSGEFVFITSSRHSSGETRFLRADAAPGTAPVLIAPRRDNELYDVDHHGKHFYMLTNAGDAVDFSVVRAPIETPDRDHWEDWLPHRPGTHVLAFVPFADRAVVLERENALPRIVIADYDREDVHEIRFEEEAYALGLDAGYEFATNEVRFTYESPSTPTQTFDYDMTSRERTLRKTQEVPSGHNPDLYAVERLFVTAADGADIPVTILRLKSTPIDGTAPLLLYGYGSYGITITADFSTGMLSLVDRGVVFATAHVRGGAAKGRQWYLDGKMQNKANTFTDFVRVAEDLQARGYGEKNRTVIYGGSAGGMLVGAAVNLRPDLFAGVVAAVPFVDVLNTISDDSLPLTPPEWTEWGDPIRDAAAYATIAGYSPYDNIRKDVPYPPVFATGGLADYRVTYWEPAKWVARLREEAGGGPFFLKTNMESGHAGSAARFESLRERADNYAFALKIFGLTERKPVSHTVQQERK